MHSQCLTKQPIPEVKTSALVFTLRLKDGGSQLRLGSHVIDEVCQLFLEFGDRLRFAVSDRLINLVKQVS